MTKGRIDKAWLACSRETCSVEGCEKRTVGRGWCGMHYQRWKRYGDPLVGGRTRGTCAIEGCEGRLSGHGLCSMHYTRWRTHGDPYFAPTFGRYGDSTEWPWCGHPRTPENTNLVTKGGRKNVPTCRTCRKADKERYNRKNGMKPFPVVYKEIDGVSYRRCSLCTEWLTLDNFIKRGGRVNQWGSRCRDCINRESRQKGKERYWTDEEYRRKKIEAACRQIMKTRAKRKSDPAWVARQQANRWLPHTRDAMLRRVDASGNPAFDEETVDYVLEKHWELLSEYYGRPSGHENSDRLSAAILLANLEKEYNDAGLMETG